MHIAIIGKGNVGAALGGGWRAAGHSTLFGVRKPVADDEASVAEAVAAAEIVALATPWSAAADAVAAAGPLAGKTLIDCTNPLVFSGGALRLDPSLPQSGAEKIAALAPGAFIFKTLNQTGAENIAAARRYPHPPAMFVAGDDPARKAVVLGLVHDLGFDALDAGPLGHAALLEAFAMLWIDQAFARGAGRDFAFARLSPAD